MASYVWVFTDDDTTVSVFTSAKKVVKFAMRACGYENDAPAFEDDEDFEVSFPGGSTEPLTEEKLLEVIRSGERAELASRSWTHYVSRERVR